MIFSQNLFRRPTQLAHYCKLSFRQLLC
ncbi:hypothetical protein B7986_10265, partial [Staphylococcus aureus]